VVWTILVNFEAVCNSKIFLAARSEFDVVSVCLKERVEIFAEVDDGLASNLILGSLEVVLDILKNFHVKRDFLLDDLIGIFNHVLDHSGINGDFEGVLSQTHLLLFLGKSEA